MTSLIDNEELERQIAEAQKEFDELSQKLVLSENRLRNLTNIRELVIRLEDLDAPSPAPAPSTFDRVFGNYTAHMVERKSGDAQSGLWTLIQAKEPTDSSKKRIRSTEMVAELVVDADEAMTREQVHRLFESIHGFPTSWQNPANALNLALGRAVNNGLIVELNNLFMSRDVAERLELADAEEEADA